MRSAWNVMKYNLLKHMEDQQTGEINMRTAKELAVKVYDKFRQRSTELWGVEFRQEMSREDKLLIELTRQSRDDEWREQEKEMDEIVRQMKKEVVAIRNDAEFIKAHDAVHKAITATKVSFMKEIDLWIEDIKKRTQPDLPETELEAKFANALVNGTMQGRIDEFKRFKQKLFGHLRVMRSEKR